MATKTFNRLIISKFLYANDRSVMLFLYGTSACHLCEEAHALLVILNREMKIAWSEVDIIDDDKLMQSYSLKIPVLYQPDNNIELCWPFSLSDIRSFLLIDSEKQKAGKAGFL